ncbi:MAG TPA: ABC transporter permease [Firmicutes bacterium]|nr:ABC transporter permease [Bacillota bacterium]
MRKSSGIGYTWYVFRRNRLTVAGTAVVLLFIAVALAAPWLAPYPGDADKEVHPERALLAPSLEHPFGTDELGRDLLSRVIFGSRISLTIGVIAIGLALLIGVPIGLVAGFFGGTVDEVLMRVTDVFMSFPPLLLSVAICAMLGPSITNAMISIGIAWWPWYTRLIRGQALSVRERGFVEAARAAGVKPWVVIVRHILPNTVAPVVVQASMDFGSVILTAASLGFLGMGAQPPSPEWGLLVSIGRSFFLNQWWYVTFPGLAIFLAVLAFNLVGDGIREIADPRTREA